MNRERIEALWRRLLLKQPLSPEEQRELVETLEADRGLRDELLRDAEIDSWLSGLGWGRRSEESFARRLQDCVVAERDSTRFIKKLESRVKEGAARPSHQTPASPSQRRATWRWLRRRGADPGALLWKLGLAAAGVFVAVVLFMTVSSPGPVTPGEGETARWRAQREEQRRKESLLRREAASQARAEREALERELARREEERVRLTEDLKRVQDAKARGDLKAREAELAKAAEAFQERLRLAREKERQAAEAVAQADAAPAPPAPKTQETRAAVAKVGQAENAVVVTKEGERVPAREGQDVLAGQGLEVPAGGSARLEYADQTRVEVKAETEIRELKAEGGKQIFIAKGEVRAVVSKQPKGQPMIFTTPHGEATVLGTTLRLIVDPDPKKGTRLEVEGGKVRLKNLAGKTVTVESGHYAVAAAGVELAVKGIFP